MNPFYFLRVGLLVLLFWRLTSLVRMFFVGKGGAVELQGERVHAFVPRTKGSIDFVRLTFEVARRLRFVLRPERAFDVWAKRWGLAREWQTGDPRFDPQVFVIAEDPLVLEHLTRDSELRNAVLHLFGSLRVTSIRVARGLLMIEAGVGCDRKATDDIAIRDVGDRLAKSLRIVRERLARIPGDASVAHERPFVRQAILSALVLALTIGGIVGCIATMSAAYYQVEFANIYRTSLFATVGVIVVLIAWTLLWLRSTSLAHRVLFDIVCGGIVGAWFTSCWLSIWFNQAADASPVRHEAVRVENLVVEGGRRRSRHYFVEVRGWPDGKSDGRLQISKTDFEAMSIGTCVDVAWRDGRLRDGWVESFGPSSVNPAC